MITTYLTSRPDPLQPSQTNDPIRVDGPCSKASRPLARLWLKNNSRRNLQYR
jgi:hypothetical protein